MAVGQADHALGLAQPIEGVHLHDDADHLGHRLAQLGRPAAAPHRGAHEEGDLLRRVVGHVGLLAPLDAGVGLDENPVQEDLDAVRSLPGVDPLADEAPGHGVQGLAHLDVDIGVDRGPRPAGQLERMAGKSDQHLLLLGVEQSLGSDTVKGPARALVGHVPAPAHGVDLHVDQGGELVRPSGIEGIPGIRHRSFDASLVPRLRAPERGR